LGKHHLTSAESHADAQSFAICYSNIDIFCIAIGDICISNFEPGRGGVGKSNANSQASPVVTPTC
jgi:hypothetical protein